MSTNKNVGSSNSTERAVLEELLKKSKESDIPTLLQAKEKAKQAVRSGPTSSNITALKHATALLEEAEKEMVNSGHNTPEQDVFKDVGTLLRYLQEQCARKIGKSKLYEDIRSGLMPQRGSAFRKIDADKYAASLPLGDTPDGRNRDAELRQKRRDDAEIRIKEAQAEREEMRNAIQQGEYIRKDDVSQELAARAIALNEGLKSALRAKGADLVIAVEGNIQKTELLLRSLDGLVDGLCSEYARVIVFEVVLDAFEENRDKEEK